MGVKTATTTANQPFLRSSLPASFHTNQPVSKPSKEFKILTATKPNWAKGFESLWEPGENGAKKRLQDFLIRLRISAPRSLENYGEDYLRGRLRRLKAFH